MPKACSADLRERVLAAVEEGAARREAAERFEVSPSSAVKWFRAWEREGRRTAKPRGGSRSPLEDHADEILALVSEHPDWTLEELVAALHRRRLPGSRSALWRFFERHGISFNVWSGRASQEGLVEVAVSGLASMYTAFGWGGYAPSHHGNQRACDLISGQTSAGHLGHQCAQAPGRPILHLVSSSRRPRREADYVNSGSSSSAERSLGGCRRDLSRLEVAPMGEDGGLLIALLRHGRVRCRGALSARKQQWVPVARSQASERCFRQGHGRAGHSP